MYQRSISTPSGSKMGFDATLCFPQFSIAQGRERSKYSRKKNIHKTPRTKLFFKKVLFRFSYNVDVGMWKFNTDPSSTWECKTIQNTEKKRVVSFISLNVCSNSSICK